MNWGVDELLLKIETTLCCLEKSNFSGFLFHSWIIFVFSFSMCNWILTFLRKIIAVYHALCSLRVYYSFSIGTSSYLLGLSQNPVVQHPPSPWLSALSFSSTLLLLGLCRLWLLSGGLYLRPAQQKSGKS